MEREPILDYAPPQRRADRPAPPGGCLVALAGVTWVFPITSTVPISADRYTTAPIWLKWIITLGHAAAVYAMFYPVAGGRAGQRALVIAAAALVSLWAGLQVVVMWFWN